MPSRFRFRHFSRFTASHASKFLRISQFLKHYLAKYNYCLERYPFLTQGISAAFLFGSGDYMCQCIEHHQQQSSSEHHQQQQSSSEHHQQQSSLGNEGTPNPLFIDLERMFRMMLYGSLVFAPSAHLWYKYLDKRMIISKHNKFKQISKKVFMDEFVFTPVILIAFFSCMTSMEHFYEQLFDKNKSNSTNHKNENNKNEWSSPSTVDHTPSIISSRSSSSSSSEWSSPSTLDSNIWKRGEEDQFTTIQNIDEIIHNDRRTLSHESSTPDLPHKIMSKLKKDYFHTFLVDMIVWPPLQYFNFFLVPSAYRVLYINFCCIFWNAFLSMQQHKH
ncbi:hypothetical protein C9374_002291 [Naegleria lovaniensis]|uniref:Uncharacterized protein n=1 Tax=Naegleria lovaniensis TaxID=51637 RepID=A0AA88KQK5_NAELO|nr:uncharacterized protein C9374_002291 [Naegleria lovaniensis]KAG2386547.1 hypothetical protein C9374_002291 [Naegleria lovaniensis]